MKKLSFYILLAAGLVATTGAARYTAFPQASVSNGIITARFYLPDTGKGYYRSTRFDWSGVMPQLEWNGHTYCAEWFDKYDPLINDAIMGPVESFSPLGYDSAKAGGHFVQIGVGTLSRPQDIAYSPFTYYPVINYGTWQWQAKSSGITFNHELQDENFSYNYKKTITLLKGKPVMVIAHHLKNTGTQAISTSVYNHNLFVIDGQPTGAGFNVKFPFPLHAAAEGQRGLGPDDIASIKDSAIVLNRSPGKRESVYCVLEGYRDKPGDYAISIENHITGAAVKITCDRPLSKLVFWGSQRIFSPEPYIQVDVPAGKTFSWTISYEFYNCSGRGHKG